MTIAGVATGLYAMLALPRVCAPPGLPQCCQLPCGGPHQARPWPQILHCHWQVPSSLPPPPSPRCPSPPNAPLHTLTPHQLVLPHSNAKLTEHLSVCNLLRGCQKCGNVPYLLLRQILCVPIAGCCIYTASLSASLAISAPYDTTIGMTASSSVDVHAGPCRRVQYEILQATQV